MYSHLFIFKFDYFYLHFMDQEELPTSINTKIVLDYLYIFLIKDLKFLKRICL